MQSPYIKTNLYLCEKTIVKNGNSKEKKAENRLIEFRSFKLQAVNCLRLIQR